MNSKIKSFLTKRSNVLKVSGQLAVFKGNQVTVTGLDFLYRLTVPGVDVNPPIYVNLSDFTMAASLLEQFEEIKRLPAKLVLASRSMRMTLPLREDGAVTPESTITNGETVDIDDSFIEGLFGIYKFFQPQTIYFMNNNKVFLRNSVSPYLGIINTDIPTEICGNYGSVSEDAILIPDASVSWLQLPNFWHLVLHQKVSNEELYTVYSAMAPADIKVVKGLNSVVDEVHELLFSRAIMFTVPEKLAKLISLPSARSITFRDNKVTLYTDTFEVDFYIEMDGKLPGREINIITSVISDLISKIPDKQVCFIFGESKNYMYYNPDGVYEIISTF